MLQRIIHEDWIVLVPIVAFVLTFSFFIGVLIKAVAMKQDKRNHLASLPLSDDSQPISDLTTETSHPSRS